MAKTKKYKKAEVKFKDVAWDAIDADKVSSSWSSGTGLYIVVWRDVVGRPNNDILFRVKLPDAIEAMAADYAESCLNGY
jgi:hypothetical protein